MPTEPQRGRHAYLQIAADLQDLIRRRELLPTEKIPSIGQLSEQYGVADQTVRKAIKILEGKGLVDTRQGVGSIVQDRPTIYREVTSRYGGDGRMPHLREVDKQGREPGVRYIDVKQLAPPPEIAGALEVDEGEEVILREHILLSEERPVGLSDSYYPLWVARGTILMRNGRVEGGTHAYMRTKGHQLHEFLEELRFRLSTPYEREVLNAEHVACTIRTLWDTDGRVLQVTQFAHDPDRYTFAARVPAS